MYRDIEDLYSEYYQELYKYIYLMTLNKYDTEDILHNTFIKVMKGIKSFKNQSTIKTWLFSIAHNECINYFSQNKRNKAESADYACITIVVQDSMDKTMLKKEEVEIILRFIRAQKEPIRSLLILRLIDEEPFGTIANILNKTDVWCRVTFYRMKRKIIDLLAQE